MNVFLGIMIFLIEKAEMLFIPNKINLKNI
jgi:hypothetical protein